MTSPIKELPPQARGRHRAHHGGDQRRGATPAGAGTTLSPASETISSRSYPRRRGDDIGRGQHSRRDRELPPQARGRRGRPFLQAVRRGATPAGAGTTTARPRRPRRSRSYPRRRGDDRPRQPRPRRASELPPQARGRHLLTWPVAGVGGEFRSVRLLSLRCPWGGGDRPDESCRRRGLACLHDSELFI